MLQRVNQSFNYRSTIVSLLIATTLLSCLKTKNNAEDIAQIVHQKSDISNEQDIIDYTDLFNKNPEYIALDFDFPVGKPNAKGYYNAQKFGQNDHLGDDWNGTGGGNSDLGDPIYAIANGYIAEAKDFGGGWGKVIRIIHQYKGKHYESVYAHCHKINVQAESFVRKGEQIGTIGNADGLYWAHLHLEIRDNIFMDLGGGYSNNTSGYLDPTTFIKNN